MRLLCHIAVCFFVLLPCASAASTATGGIQKNAVAWNVSDGSPRLETTEADEPTRLQPQDSVADKNDGKHREQEDRGINEPWMSDAGHLLLEADELLLTQQPHLKGALARLMLKKEIETSDARANLIQWIPKSHMPGPVEAYPAASLSVLMKNGRGGEVAEVFLWLRGFEHRKDFADMCQRTLLTQYPEAWPLVSEVWLKSSLSPTEAYRMMLSSPPLAAMNEPHDWFVFCRTMARWMDYLYQYRSLGHDYSDSQVVQVLADKNTGVLKTFFDWVGTVPSAKDDADRMQRSLESLPTLNRWIESKVSPDQAYWQSPKLVNFRLDASDGEASDWAAFLSEFEHWLTFIDVYRSRSNVFTDNHIVEVMKNGGRKNGALKNSLVNNELVKIFQKLRDVPGMKNRADSLQRCLLSDQKILKEHESIHKVWLDSMVHPTELYRILFGPATTSNMQAAVWNPEWKLIRSKLKFWVWYGVKYQSRFGGFDNDQVVDVLKLNRHEQDILYFFNWLQSRRGMEERAEYMQRRMLWISHNKLATFEMMSKVWLGFLVGPTEVLRIMLPPATGHHVAAADRMADWPAIFTTLELWFKYGARYGRLNKGFEDATAVDTLRRNRDEDEVVYFLTSFRTRQDMQSRSDLMLTRMILGSQHQSETLRLMFEAWLQSSVSPVEVYHIMVSSSKLRSGATASGSMGQPDIYFLLKEWLKYVRLYRSVFVTFDDVQVVIVLRHNEGYDGARRFLTRLRGDPDLGAEADTLLQLLKGRPHSTVWN
ncbi:unnamed protein product [Hyaloperonospora brassicae]|uniref:RXLR phytopathogen effector protein WY-domain domain-containing protein n=1 Tax=Hyaloperonospora brassicae TaxID=162125 RepID=A0AAV0T108_HYABA|nr:unnamed protein product [Hyaloperonospora brassicae]